MTECGKIFAEIIRDVCWTKGWGTTGTTERFPEIKNGAELEWLVSNGYLFHYHNEVTNNTRNWRYRNRTADIYGLTKKGWTIAGKYVDAAKREIEGYEIAYQFEYYPHRTEK